MSSMKLTADVILPEVVWALSSLACTVPGDGQLVWLTIALLAARAMIEARRAPGVGAW